MKKAKELYNEFAIKCKYDLTPITKDVMRLIKKAQQEKDKQLNTLKKRLVEAEQKLKNYKEQNLRLIKDNKKITDLKVREKAKEIKEKIKSTLGVMESYDYTNGNEKAVHTLMVKYVKDLLKNI